MIPEADKKQKPSSPAGGFGTVSNLTAPANIDTPLASALLTRRLSPNVCKAVHDLVIEFRAAHGITSPTSPEREKAIRRYPLSKAPTAEVPAIEAISSENKYAEIRQGGRLTTVYPPLPTPILKNVCREIRAAFVWSAQLRAASGR